MKEHLACLSFDVDAMSASVARGAISPTQISRGEFCVVGIRRILALLEKYGIHATFFIPGVVIGTYPAACAAIAEAGHEIGHHGWTHVPPASLTPEQEESALVRGSEAIRRLCGKDPAGYRSPAWDLSPVTADLLMRHGFAYDSSMMGDDHTPYFVRTGDVADPDGPYRFGTPTTLVEMPISWSLDDFPHFEFSRTPNGYLPGLMNAGGVLENWLADFEYMTGDVQWGALTYTMHPFVIGRGHRMLMLERLVRGLLERGARFARMVDVVDAFRERSGKAPSAPERAGTASSAHDPADRTPSAPAPNSTAPRAPDASS